MTDGLAGLSEAALKAFRQKVATGRLATPLTEAQLKSEGLEKLLGLLPMLSELSNQSLLSLVDLILMERQRADRTQLSLVWTGPNESASTARETWVVFRELVASAQRRVLIAGFRFDHGAQLLEPLHRAMCTLGVSTQIFLDVPPARPDVPVREHAHRFIDEFLIANWPFGPPFPEFFYDPRTVDAKARASLHAKCVVVDDKRTLVGSANFTNRGQSRNIELGVLIEGSQFASEVSAHWQHLVRTGLLEQNE